VLIHDDTPRKQWKLAVIEGLNKGEDGLIRSANVRTSSGQTNRPITKLYSLEVTAAEQPTTMDNTREMPATPTQPPPQHRPVCQVALRGRRRVQQWIDSLAYPPFPRGCLVLTDRHYSIIVVSLYCCYCRLCACVLLTL